MFFYFKNEGPRRFWMPDTYFDLDIFFLDNQFKVIALERKVPHHPGRKEPIPRTKTYMARHVLEIPSDSPIAQYIEKGSELKWIGPPSFQEIESNIRP